jgi:hypothetical protein
MSTQLTAHDASFYRIAPIDGSLVIMGDISVNGQIFSSGGLVGGGGGGSGTDASFNVIDEFLDGSGVTFLTDVSINGDLKNSGFADLSNKVFLNTVTTTFNTGTIVDLSDVVTAMSTHLVAVDASFLNDVNVKGNLYVDGSFNFSEVVKNITTVDNELLISTQVDISNYGTGPALSVTQHGDGVGDNLVLLHAGTEGTAVEVKGDGKSIFYKDVDISGKLVLLDDISINGNLIYGGFADISNKVFLNTVTTTFNTGTIVDLSDVVTAMSTQLTTHDASFGKIGPTDGSLIVMGDLSINGDIVAHNVKNIKKYEIIDNMPSIGDNPGNPYWTTPHIKTVGEGTIIIHNIKVSSRLKTGYIDFPGGGHEYILKRTPSGGSIESIDSFYHNFSSQDVFEEATHTYIEKIDSQYTYTDWRVDISGDGIKNDNLNKLTWDITEFSPKILSTAPPSNVRSITLFDSTSGTDGSWNKYENFFIPGGSIVIHDIKVSGFVSPGYVDWPTSGHEFIFQHRYNDDAGAPTWNGVKSYEHVKHIFDAQNVHEEQDYTILEPKTSTDRTYTSWYCDLSGDKGTVDSNDALTWKITAITPSDYNHVNDYSYGQVIPAGMLSGTIDGQRIPHDISGYLQTGTSVGSISQDVYGQKTFKDALTVDNSLNVGGNLTVDNRLNVGGNLDISGTLVVSGDSSIKVLTTPTNTTHAINQAYADSNYKLDFGFVQTNDPVATADIPDILKGQPPASDPNLYGGMLDMLSVDITPIKSGARVLCQYSIVGEWEQGSWDNMTYIAVATKNADETYTYNRFLRAVGSGSRSAGISGFNIKFHIDNQSTMEQSTGQFIDQSDSLNANQTYRFTPVLVNTGELNPKMFYMNRTKIDTNSFAYERGCSSFVCQVLGYA